MGKKKLVFTHTKKKLAAGLRDTQLFDIFENAFQILEGILLKSIPFDKRKSCIDPFSKIREFLHSFMYQLIKKIERGR